MSETPIPLKFKYRDPANEPVRSNGPYKSRSGSRGGDKHKWRKDPKNR